LLGKRFIAYNSFTMPSWFMNKVTISSAWLALGVLAVLPVAVKADTVTVDFTISLNSLAGTGQFTYDPAQATSDGAAGGPYADANDGLKSFSLTYDGTTYSDTSATLLDGPILPTVFLPGNTTIPGGLQYGFLALWVASGSCTSTGTAGDYNCLDATIIGLGRSPEVFLASGVTGADISFSGSELKYILGPPGGVSEITGTITSEAVATPEPALFPVMALGLAGLWFGRRRKVSL
jgi:hypothetical protein